MVASLKTTNVMHIHTVYKHIFATASHHSANQHAFFSCKQGKNLFLNTARQLI
jgi:hypothetical protein